MTKVIFIPGNREGFEKGKDMGKVFMALRKFGFDDFAGKRVLVKLHMGEVGNKFYLKPDVIKHFIDELKSIKSKPLLFDTAVKYPGGRDTKEKYARTAKKHGFEKIGKVVIGNEGHTVNVKVGENTYGFEVAKEVCDAERILSIAHGKGHMMTGFGGAIKAFGMGGVSKESKGFIHGAGAPVLENKEKCELCGTCANECPMGAITVGDEWKIDYGKCFGCERCVDVCPKGALVWKGEDFDQMLAAGSAACLNVTDKNNKPKKKIFVNILTDISKRCDCATHAGPIIAPDIGIVVSDDPVAIDAASIDLIENAAGKPLKKIQGIDPRAHVSFAEQFGMGSMKYELVEA